MEEHNIYKAAEDGESEPVKHAAKRMPFLLPLCSKAGRCQIEAVGRAPRCWWWVGMDLERPELMSRLPICRWINENARGFVGQPDLHFRNPRGYQNHSCRIYISQTNEGQCLNLRTIFAKD
jgi:hypothetical protein